MRDLKPEESAAIFALIPDDVRCDLTLLSGWMEQYEDEHGALTDADHAWLRVRRTDEREFNLRVRRADGKPDPLPDGGEAGGEAPNWRWGSRHHHTRDAVAAPPRHAFRCRNCGRLHDAAHGGERATPSACSVCDAGRSFNRRTGMPEFDASNWEILADATDERLAELGLAREHVARHKPAKAVPRTGPPKTITVTVQDGARTQDRVR